MDAESPLRLKESFLLHLGHNNSSQNDETDTNVLRPFDDGQFLIDEVCIEEEEETLTETRNIYNTVDSLQAKGETYALDKAIKKMCSPGNMPQNVRRSERIQMRLIQKECNLASSSLTYEPTLNKTTNSHRKSKATSKKKPKSVQNGAPSNLVSSISQSSNKRHFVKVPERIDGISYRNGKEYFAIKWKKKKLVEFIPRENLTDNLKKLALSYLHSRILILSSNEGNSSQERDSSPLERGNFVCPEEEHMQMVREIPVCQEREQCMPIITEDTVYQEREERSLCENIKDCYPVSQADERSIRTNCTVKNTIPIDVPSSNLQKINILHFKRKQKLFIEKSGILNNYNGNKIDIKLGF